MGARFLLFFTVVIATACGQRAPKSETDVRPLALKHAVHSNIGSMCFVEQVNQYPVRDLPNFRPGSSVVFSGWANVASNQNPTPRHVHVVLRPRAGTARDAYLEMARAPRPDISGADPRREMIGFEGEARLPGMGTYEVLVSQSDGSWETVCRTGIELDIGA